MSNLLSTKIRTVRMLGKLNEEQLSLYDEKMSEMLSDAVIGHVPEDAANPSSVSAMEPRSVMMIDDEAVELNDEAEEQCEVQQVSGVTQPEPASLSDTAPEALPAGGQPAEQPDPQPGDQTTTAVKHSTHGWFADHLTLSIQPANLPHVTISSRLIVVTHVVTWILFVCACVIRSPCIALTMMYMCRQQHVKCHNSDVAGGGESLTRRPGVCCGDKGAMPPCGEALRHPSPDRPTRHPIAHSTGRDTYLTS